MDYGERKETFPYNASITNYITNRVNKEIILAGM